MSDPRRWSFTALIRYAPGCGHGGICDARPTREEAIQAAKDWLSTHYEKIKNHVWFLSPYCTIEVRDNTIGAQVSWLEPYPTKEEFRARCMRERDDDRHQTNEPSDG